jgi:4-carboxymuconolactone decarboxylase
MRQMSAIPLAPLPDDIAERVSALGAHQVNLYRALAHAPGLLRAWMDFAWLLRGHTATSRRLRELMILRTAQLHHSPYEWHQHRRMAKDEGVPETQVAELEMWRTSTAFDECEKAALALTDAIVEGDTTPEIIEELEKHFGYEQRVELTVTAAFYAMVPRILDSLGVPIEGSADEAQVLDATADGNGNGNIPAAATQDGLPRADAR